MTKEKTQPRALELRLQFEDYVHGLVFSRQRGTKRLGEAMRHSLLAGGRRIRPMLTLATAQTLGMSPASVLPLAAAVEMIHTHSLVHADLPPINGNHLRRGKPATHIVFGEDIALLASDALFAEAMALLFGYQEGEPIRVLAAINELTRAIGPSGLIGGQYIDISSDDELEQGALRQLHELRTGRPIAAAVGTVLTLSGESGPAATTLRRFAAEVGMLSQIVDDIRHETADHETASRSDSRRGRRTYVSLFGPERAQELARESHARASADLANVPADTSALASIADFIESDP
jgi:geranylgeranyl diphosphate synthase type II